MTIFWGFAAIMIMMALLFVLPPLLRMRKISAVTPDDLNTTVIKEQLAELETDLLAGRLDEDQFDAARKDLEQELLYDLASADSTKTNTVERSGRWLTLLLIPAIPLCAVLLYLMMGSGELIEALQQAKVSQPESANQQSTAADSLDVMAAQLAERLRSEPDDLQGWVMLAKTYNVMGRPDEAASAYENAFRLGSDDDPNILADYADSAVSANGGKFTDREGELLLRALELEPDHLKALWLTGHWKYDNHEYADALQYWQKAAQQLPADSEDAKIIAQQISNAQNRLGTSVAPVPATISKTAGTAALVKSIIEASINVHVALDPALNALVAPEDTVFIYARPIQGTRMPLAIIRKQVKDLPVTVTLDDSLAMSPEMVLSKFDQVTVIARISKTGSAMPQSGDLQGIVSPVTTTVTENIQILINSKAP